MSSMFTDTSPVRFADALPDETDVVVIGAGVAGTATAWFLAGQGVRVVLCEKGRVAGEQSSRNWGWVRQQGRDHAELPVMMEANRIWRGLAEETGDTDLAFTQSGCLYLADTAARMARYEKWYALAREHQLATRMLSKSDIAAEFPGLGGSWAGGMVTDTDGRAEPLRAVPAFARAVQRAGGAVVENCAVRTLDLEAGRVAGVITERGRIRCRQVVLAGGVWSTFFAANEGQVLPQLAVRSTAARTGPAADAYAANTSTPGLSIRRREDGGYTVATGDLAEHYLSRESFRFLPRYRSLLKASARDVRLRAAAPKNYPGAWGMQRRWKPDERSPFERMRVVNPEPSLQVVRKIEKRLPQRFPALAGIKVAEAWAGMIDVTPDAVPVLDEVPSISGFFIATGLSGHGFGIGPAVGRIVADLVTGRSSGHDLTRFRFSRFSDRSPVVPGPY